MKNVCITSARTNERTWKAEQIRLWKYGGIQLTETMKKYQLETNLIKKGTHARASFHGTSCIYMLRSYLAACWTCEREQCICVCWRLCWSRMRHVCIRMLNKYMYELSLLRTTNEYERKKERFSSLFSLSFSIVSIGFVCCRLGAEKFLYIHIRARYATVYTVCNTNPYVAWVNRVPHSVAVVS